MKTAFLIDVGDGSELEKLKEALTLLGYPPQVVSSFGIDLGNSDGSEEEVSIPPLPRRRGRVAEAQEVQMAVRGVETHYDNPDARVRNQRGESYIVRGGPEYINVRLDLAAPFEDQKILSLLQRIQATGIVAIRNVER